MTLNPETVRELTIAGAGAVVLPSLVEEEIVQRGMDAGGDPSIGEQPVEAVGAAIREGGYAGGVDRYLNAIATLKNNTGIPIIANMNGFTEGRWIEFAREIENRGADAIELSLQTDTSNPSLGADEVESPLVRAVEAVRDAVSIPVSVKLLPFFTTLPNLVWRLVEAGVSGVALFGREPIWQVGDGGMMPTSHWSLSDSGQLQTTLSGLIRLRASGSEISVAASGGITTAKDVLNAVIAGADVAMITSEIYRTGPDAIAHILEGIVNCLQRQRIDSFKKFVARNHLVAPSTPTRQI
jgi:dihydroorotate dehydrogenase (fumarate)